ncbi:MAG: 16S rRNA (guanine(966)-N(2))-methyltransferase RsmD [Actinobacteria bacterium]|jgi:16S rRNA (guanine966-N2)-methyltransferase|nr:16S rRNA (guanine(966)-N(2))-methyltransferase RsmD [Actinomycetota bacterium]MBT3745453.1 16S rRNA (guanine(966)-N(2))-methyltransferase RsmD [Actinomycetota bacterium]MBT3970439.1 16S rRNA (guanine(966)-N(2))-methyltransferase RsmD [Actinomycetota bacterium]MBT4010360.1 16S rRNA (guanine(966)-N(2))-methyltransferase RsmD [Actinomycetota bacterium]MBT4303680.1 16S rRNA (guanine(966)-N(2))-methyltransferase RsmD [Actinomycetota bacterium]
MRVIAGTARGRRLKSPQDDSARPTTDRVREAVFNALFSLGALEDAVVLDLFAGSGALAIEALSRGAKRAVLVEKSSRHTELINENLALCHFDDQSEVHRADAFTWLSTHQETWDLVFLDPPYDFDEWEKLLKNVKAKLVVLESNREIDPGPEWDVLRSRRYGATVVVVAAVGPPENDVQKEGSSVS